MFDEIPIAVAVLAALALAVVLVVFAISIRFVNDIMRRRRLRTGREALSAGEDKAHTKEGENR